MRALVDLRKIARDATNHVDGGHPAALRSCGLGWHSQCSDRVGLDCGCPCHTFVAVFDPALVSALLDVAESGRDIGRFLDDEGPCLDCGYVTEHRACCVVVRFSGVLDRLSEVTA